MLEIACLISQNFLMLNKVQNGKILNWWCTYIIPYSCIRPTPVWLLKGSAKIDILAEALKAAMELGA